MSDTPETDAKASPHIGFYSCATVPAEFARKLERERDEAREELANLESLMFGGLVQPAPKNALAWRVFDAVMAMKKERDEAREDLAAEIKHHTETTAKWNGHHMDLTITQCDLNKALRERDEAREALDQASLYISEFTGSCPNESLDVEPHDEPCSCVCDKYANDMHLCWKKHFTNKEAAK